MEQVFQFVHDIWLTLRNGGFPELGWWSYALLVLLAATEGPFSVLLGAAAAAAGYLRLDYVYFSAVAGNLIGDTVWYLIGYVGKADRVARFGRFLRIHPEHIDRLEVAIHAHATKLILLAKLSITLMIPTLVAAGMARVPWRRWFPIVFAIELIWTGMLVWVGYHATGLISNVEHWRHVAAVVAIVALLAAIVWYVRRLIHREEALEIEEDLLSSPLPSPPQPHHRGPTHPAGDHTPMMMVVAHEPRMHIPHDSKDLV